MLLYLAWRLLAPLARALPLSIAYILSNAMMDAAALAKMPSDAAFAMTTQVCSVCHERFRAEKD